MVSSSENSKSPFRGLECLRPVERGERYVAVATNKLYASVKPLASSLAWFQEPSSSMAHDVLWLAFAMITLTKSLFTWKTAGILTGVKLATLAVVLGLARAGLLPGWFPHWG